MFFFLSRFLLSSGPFCPPPSPIWLSLVPAPKRGGVRITITYETGHRHACVLFASLHFVPSHWRSCACAGSRSFSLPVSLVQRSLERGPSRRRSEEGGFSASQSVRLSSTTFSHSPISRH